MDLCPRCNRPLNGAEYCLNCHMLVSQMTEEQFTANRARGVDDQVKQIKRIKNLLAIAAAALAVLSFLCYAIHSYIVEKSPEIVPQEYSASTKPGTFVKTTLVCITPFAREVEVREGESKENGKTKGLYYIAVNQNGDLFLLSLLKSEYENKYSDIANDTAILTLLLGEVPDSDKSVPVIATADDISDNTIKKIEKDSEVCWMYKQLNLEHQLYIREEAPHEGGGEGFVTAGNLLGFAAVIALLAFLYIRKRYKNALMLRTVYAEKLYWKTLANRSANSPREKTASSSGSRDTDGDYFGGHFSE